MPRFKAAAARESLEGVDVGVGVEVGLGVRTGVGVGIGVVIGLPNRDWPRQARARRATIKNISSQSSGF